MARIPSFLIAATRWLAVAGNSATNLQNLGAMIKTQNKLGDVPAGLP
jgi:hypothetical protein